MLHLFLQFKFKISKEIYIKLLNKYKFNGYPSEIMINLR